jgi:hypothetical protein
MIRKTLLNQKKNAEILELVHSIDWNDVFFKGLHDEEINKIKKLVNETKTN